MRDNSKFCCFDYISFTTIWKNKKTVIYVVYSYSMYKIVY